MQRLEWTLEILEAAPGTLFANDYLALSTASRTKAKSSLYADTGPPITSKQKPPAVCPNSSEAAWTLADPVCQKVEFLLRGYAHSIAGTQWNRWVTSNNNNHNYTMGLGRKDNDNDDDEDVNDLDNTTSLALINMLSLMDRLQEEGYLYMQLRADRMEELEALSDDETMSDSDSSEMLASSLNDFEDSDSSNGENEIIKERENPIDDEAGLEQDLDELESGEEDSDDDEEEEEYMDDFAAPGPTVHMYDIFLDTVACSMMSGTELASTIIDCHDCLGFLGEIVARHELDGGDLRNRNPHTIPTLQSFNSAIRIAANAPWSSSAGNDDADTAATDRENALILALGAFDALSQSAILERNSATYTYLLQTIAKYFPPSQSRGNIARGMWQHALLQGVIDEGVMDAMIAVNTPSNGPIHDKYVQETIAGKQLNDLTHKWRRFCRVRRLHPHEATY